MEKTNVEYDKLSKSKALPQGVKRVVVGRQRQRIKMHTLLISMNQVQETSKIYD